MCRDAPKEVTSHNWKLYDSVIVPAIEKAVNSDPKFSELRRVYNSRIVAAWIRQQDAQQPTAFHDIINSGDVSRWPARQPWSREKVYAEFLESYRQGDFSVPYTVERDGKPVTFLATTGGVDFAAAPSEPVSKEKFTAEHPTLPATVSESRLAPIGYAEAEATWLGGGTFQQREPTQPPESTAPTQPPTTTPGPAATGGPAQAGESAPPGAPERGDGAEGTQAGPAHENLANTGASWMWLLPVGLAMIAIGAAFLLVRRRNAQLVPPRRSGR